MYKVCAGLGILIGFWSPVISSQPTQQDLLRDETRLALSQGLSEALSRGYSETEELEAFFQSDPVDAAWADEMASRIVDSLTSLDFDFRRLEVACKTAICKVESSIRFGTVTGERASRLYFNAYREISDRGLWPIMRADGFRLSGIIGDLGPVSTHYLYSSEFDPTPPEVREALRSLGLPVEDAVQD